VIVAISDLCDLVVEQVHPKDFEATYPYLGLEHLAPGKLEPIASGQAADANSHKYRFRRGDVLYSKLRPNLDKAVLADADGICTTELLVLRPRPNVDPRFLACLFHAPKFVEHALAGITGSHHPRTSWNHVAQFEVQSFDQKIQSVAAELLWFVHRLATTSGLAAESAYAVKRIAAGTIFSSGLRGEAQKDTDIGRLPGCWSLVSLGSLGKIGNGSTPKKTVAAYWSGGTLPWLNSAKVYDREIDTADQFASDVALAECHLPRLKPGAVLMAITGQGKTLGHCAVLRIEASVSQHVAYLQTDTTKANPSFLRGYLETQYDALRQVAAGGGSTKGALTCAYLRDLKVPLPSIEEQDEIVTILDALDRKIDLHRRKRAILEDLFKTLLHKLMTGEIAVSDLDLSALSTASVTPEGATA
jgi:type I restriction enzyme S subunit